MKLNLFFLLCLTGLVSVIPQAVRHDYHLITTPAMWSDAQSYCRNIYDDLATVQTDDDWKRLKAEAARKGLTATGWVGLYNGPNSWHWSNYFKVLTYRIIFWAPGQPDNAGGKEACVAVDLWGYWADYPCKSNKPFICYNATLNEFVAVPLPMNWWGSQNYCEIYHTDLANVTNETQNDELRELALLQGTSWIGLHRYTWNWSDRSQAGNLRWSPGFPNNVDHNDDCASVNNSLLVDRQCNSLFYFFCQTQYTVRKYVVKLQVKGGKSVFDPVVKPAILQQIVQKLKEHGITEEKKVTWRVQPDGNIFRKKSKYDL